MRYTMQRRCDTYAMRHTPISDYRVLTFASPAESRSLRYLLNHPLNRLERHSEIRSRDRAWPASTGQGVSGNVRVRLLRWTFDRSARRGRISRIRRSSGGPLTPMRIT